MRQTTSGGAGMTAVRLARGATGRNKIIKFAGCYHGHLDALLAQAGSGLATLAMPGSAGVTVATADTLLLTVPNQLGVEYNAHVIENVVRHVAPALGWR